MAIHQKLENRIQEQGGMKNEQHKHIKSKEITTTSTEHTLENPERSELKYSPLMIWGPPGVGKSTFIRKLCEENDIGFIDVRLAQREPVDIRGLPVPRDDKSGIDWIVSSEWPREDDDSLPSRGISYSMKLLQPIVHCR